MQSAPIGAADREITSSRIFRAPRQLVYEMWTDPDHIQHWYGPSGFRDTIHEMDVRPGGAWRHTLHGPDGTDYENESVYREVVPLERLVFEHLTFPRHVTKITFKD